MAMESTSGGFGYTPPHLQTATAMPKPAITGMTGAAPAANTVGHSVAPAWTGGAKVQGLSYGYGLAPKPTATSAGSAASLGYRAADPGMTAQNQVNAARDRLNYFNQNEQPWLRQAANNQIGWAGQAAQGQFQSAQQHDARYWNTVVPMQDKLIGQVDYYDSDAHKNNQVGMAMAGQQKQFTNMEDQRNRDLQRRGVNPYSGRALGDARSLDIEKANAMNSAAVKTRMAADQIGLQNRMALNEQLQPSAMYGTQAAQVGSQALQNIQGAMTAYGNVTNDAFQTGMSAWGQGVQGMNAAYASSIDDARRRDNFALTNQANMNQFNLGVYNGGINDMSRLDDYNLGVYGHNIADANRQNQYELGLYQGRIQQRGQDHDLAAANSRASVAQRGQNQEMWGTIGGAVGTAFGGPIGAAAGAVGGALLGGLFD